jgi:hypothetical protein
LLFYRACEEAASLCDALDLKIEDVGLDAGTISSNAETFKTKVEAKKMEIEKAKKSQKKDIVRVSYFSSIIG